uniref:Uncharacterized protein n=1 Tax=Tanacetum cinerariifolium TaxID=118510 RepID=A0A6L2KVV0_TANCI|nr:hypothetical protein [Tanacetum cinerariifolium]
MTWARFRKKRDKNTSLGSQSVKTASGFATTPSEVKGDDVTTTCDVVTITDIKKPLEDSHLEEKHMTWARFGKKRDKNTSLGSQSVETASGFATTPSEVKGDDVTMTCDVVTITDIKKPLEDSVG